MSIVRPTVLRSCVLARSFFGNREQFAEDLGLTSTEGRWRLLWDYVGVSYGQGAAGLRGIWLNVTWFFIVWGAFVLVDTLHSIP